ncbi:MAG: DUF6526 family protein [Calditrichaceae bacterium]
MSQQNYSNHRRWVPLYHFFLSLFILLTTIGSIVNLIKTGSGSAGFYSASLILAVNIALLIIFVYMRTFALKAQDRAIRAEENLRHFVMTGKLMDPRVSMRQVIGLRFASDAEFQPLIERAVKENLSEEDIKKAVKNWKPDTYRV